MLRREQVPKKTVATKKDLCMVIGGSITEAESLTKARVTLQTLSRRVASVKAGVLGLQ